MEQAALTSTTSCCPGLQALQCNLQPAVNVGLLTALHSLTELDLNLGLSGSAQEAKASIRSVAAITHLKGLVLAWCGEHNAMHLLTSCP